MNFGNLVMAPIDEILAVAAAFMLSGCRIGFRFHPSPSARG